MSRQLHAPPDSTAPAGSTGPPAALRFATRLFAGLFAGFLLGVVVLESSLRSADAVTYAQVRSVELDRLDLLASLTLLPALCLGAALAVTAYRTGRTWVPNAIAVALLAVVALISVTVNLPINAQQTNWTGHGIPADWSAVRDRWQAAHALRTAAALIAFGILLLPAGLRPRAH
ncbi:anthrone oxygenase family protein [Nocardia fusca]|uniref:anthrone oxygenase family protein n=1 Tax=Nocardia fusca TaxID=941183 RepID=UPI003791C1CF